MHLTDIERQAIASKEALTDQAKKELSKSGILRCGLCFPPKSKHTRKSKMHIWAPAHIARKGRRKAPITSLGWSTSTAMAMDWVSSASPVGQGIPGPTSSSAKVLQQQRSMPETLWDWCCWEGLVLPSPATLGRDQRTSAQETSSEIQSGLRTQEAREQGRLRTAGSRQTQIIKKTPPNHWRCLK